MPSTTTKTISNKKFRSMQESDRFFPAVAERMRTAERDLETVRAEVESLKNEVTFWKDSYFKCFEKNICLRAFGVDYVPENETLETVKI
ncbi:MAG: hypothetical protein GX638_02780 [Crenarchaeota archaeon]|nr:hypothetical protein [Thermoproteota archaeon]